MDCVWSFSAIDSLRIKKTMRNVYIANILSIAGGEKLFVLSWLLIDV